MQPRRTILFLLTLTVPIIGCGRKARIAAEERATAAETRLTQMDAITATKDSLVQEMLATTSFMNQLNEDLARVETTKAKGTVTYQERVMGVSEYRTSLLARLDSVITRLDDSEARLKTSEARLRALAGKDRHLTDQVVALDSMIAEYRIIADQQRTQIDQLTARADSLQTENKQLAADKTQLTEEKTQLTTQVTDLTNFANRVYYVIGTKKELLTNGIASETGGARFLGIGWKSGKALVPSRNIDETRFTPITKNLDFEIALPRSDKKYAIVSPQNVSYLEPRADKDGNFRGKLHIVDPDAFWAASKYLIVVER